MMKPTSQRQAAALEALLSEREYQRAQQGNAKPHTTGERQGAGHPAEFITYMQKCLDDARNAVYRGETGHAECLPFIRKVGALAMACMEANGAPPREGFEVFLASIDYRRMPPPAADLAATMKD